MGTHPILTRRAYSGNPSPNKEARRKAMKLPLPRAWRRRAQPAPQIPAIPLDGNQAHTVAPGRQVVTVPATASMVRVLRQVTAGFLVGHPRRDEAQRIISEFATTAVIENRCTCCPHEQITLTVERDEQRTRLEVSYHLSLTHRPVWDSDEIIAYGHGEALLDALTNHRWGHYGRFQLGKLRYSDDDQVWYAELDNASPQPAGFGHRA